MRALSLFFSLMITLLSFIPCNDISLNEGRQQQTSFTASHENTGAVNDVCSPFCTCACCTTPPVTQMHTFVLSAPQSDEFTYAAHIPGNFIQVALPVWQPPQSA
jgi:hypothetical protein